MIDYKNPHLVMLFFEQIQPYNKAKNEQSFIQQMAYYEMLRSNGKVTMTGDLYNQHKFFVIVNVSCDSELEDILGNDPAIKQNVCELVRAMPFVEV
jgi:murein endopeptidase